LFQSVADCCDETLSREWLLNKSCSGNVSLEIVGLFLIQSADGDRGITLEKILRKKKLRLEKLHPIDSFSRRPILAADDLNRTRR